MKKMHTLLLGVLPILLLLVTCGQDTPTSVSQTGEKDSIALPGYSLLKKGAKPSVFAMLDDFATETTGASGSGSVKVRKRSVQIKVKAKNLLAKHAYELNVTIGPDGSFPPSTFVTFGPVTSKKKGKVKFKEDLDLVGLFGPGTYRLDFFITHDHSTGTGEFLGLDRDPLLRCAPFTEVTVK